MCFSEWLRCQAIPYNADFLHRNLLSWSMPERDALWSTWLHHAWQEEGSAVRRLVDWAWQGGEKAHLDDEAVRLAGIALAWLLTTPNRYLRDAATKASVALFQERLSLLPDLLRRFKDVDDLYVSERLYAVAYGCVMRAAHDAGRWDEIATVAQTVFDLVFADGDPPPHILLRDYARGVVEPSS